MIDTGVIYCDDNLERLRMLPDASVDLVYLDPPFFSNRVYEVIWGDEAEVRSFTDRWKGGIEHYIGWMEERCVELHRVLKQTGSLYLHCDTAASHYLKVRLDRIFGQQNFRNEIVWKRTSAHNNTKQGRKQYGRIHDLILFYTRGTDWRWNPLYTPYDQEYINQFYKHIEPETGRRYRLSDLTANKPGGDTSYEWHGAKPYRGRYWAYSRDQMDRFLEEDRIAFSKGGMPSYKRYLDEMPGVPLQDIWVDIKPVGKKKRQGYPTEKPELLLERIIGSSSNRDDIILDPFCGCGTTLAVADRLGRRWIGIDISPTAVRVMERRLYPAVVNVEGCPETEDDLRSLKPFEFQNWVIDALHGTHAPRKSSDMGIDGYTFLERLPIQVKQTGSVGRPDIDSFQTAVRREGKHKGYVVGFGFTRGAYEEVARAEREDGLKIGLVEVSVILGNPVEHLLDRPLQPGLPQLAVELLEGARRAVWKQGSRSWSSRRTARELVDSATS